MSAPVGIKPPAGAVGALASIAASREVEEVRAAMVIARTFPRDHMQAMDRLLNACTRPSLAEAGLYTYSRGGSDVSGPSIRLAEAAAQCWGNIQFGIREIEQNDGESVVEVYAWDIETNTRPNKTFHVPHERHTRRGVQRLTDPRDIYELVANQGARRLRACILSVIPGDVIEAAVAQCRITMSASADTSPEAQKVLLERFAEFGVTKAQIEKRIQRRLDAIQPAQVVMLRGVYRSLKDGMSKTADWFEADTQTSTGGITPPPQLQEAQSAPVEAQAAPVAAEPVAEPVAAPVAQEKPARVIGRQARPAATAATAAPAAAPATAAAPAAPAEDPEPEPGHEPTAADTGETVQQDDFLS
jgi:hypothetical protein